MCLLKSLWLIVGGFSNAEGVYLEHHADTVLSQQGGALVIETAKQFTYFASPLRVLPPKSLNTVSCAVVRANAKG